LNDVAYCFLLISRLFTFKVSYLLFYNCLAGLKLEKRSRRK
jgi:hypothetical protein